MKRVVYDHPYLSVFAVLYIIARICDLLIAVFGK